ncbi:MAG TPA: hypothetical protein VF223_01015 [Trebonia sp.]
MSDWLSGLGSRWRKAVHDFREQVQMPGPNVELDQEPVDIRCDRFRSPADVTLDPGAQQWLAPTWNPPPPDFSEIFVLLAEAEGGGGNQVEVYINKHRLGTLTSADSTDFRPILAAARADGRPVLGVAIRDRDTGGDLALHIYRPEPPPRNQLNNND